MQKNLESCSVAILERTGTGTFGREYRKVLPYTYNGKTYMSRNASSGPHKVTHYDLSHNFTKQLSDVLHMCWNSTTKVMLAWNCDRALEGVSSRREINLNCTKVKSYVGIIDIDDLDGSPIPRNTSMTEEEQIDLLIPQLLPVEMLDAPMVVRMSSGYYQKNRKFLKLHIFVELAMPVTHGVWSTFVATHIPAADPALHKNPSQVLYGAMPEACEHMKPVIYQYKGSKKLFVDSTIYTPVIRQVGGKALAEGVRPEFTLNPLGKSLTDVDLSVGSHSKIFSLVINEIHALRDPTKTLAKQRNFIKSRGLLDKWKSQENGAYKIALQNTHDDFYGITPTLLKKDFVADHVKLTPTFVNASGAYCTDFSSAINLETPTINLIKADTGSGKTYMVEQAIKADPSKSILIISDSKALTRKYRLGFDAEVVNGDYTNLTTSDLMDAKNVSITIHSLYHRLSECLALGKRFDYVLWDEAEAGIKVLLSLPDERKRIGTVNTLRGFCARSEYNVFTDADLTSTNVGHLDTVLGEQTEQKNPFKYEKSYFRKEDFKGRKVTMLPTPTALEDQLIESISAGNKVFAIILDKSRIHKHLEPLLSNIRCFSSDTEGTDEHQKFVSNPNQYAKDYKGSIICTSVIRAGISIEGVYDEVYVSAALRCTVGTEVIQMLSRERHWKQAYIYTNSTRGKAESICTNPTVWDLALKDLQSIRIGQSQSRPLDVASKLHRRGAELVIVPRVAKLRRDKVAVSYAKKGEKLRVAFEKHIAREMYGKDTYVVSAAQELMARDGYPGFSDTNALYNWIQSDQQLKIQFGSTRAKVNRTLLQLCGINTPLLLERLRGINFTAKQVATLPADDCVYHRCFAQSENVQKVLKYIDETSFVEDAPQEFWLTIPGITYTDLEYEGILDL